jgi:hypothetical protein
MRTEFAAAFVCLMLFGCGHDESDTGSAAQLSQCVEGWWQDPTPSACSCPGAPECSASDCAARRVIGFTSEHTSWTGIVQVSDGARSASPNGSLSKGTWAAEDGTIRIEPTDAPAYTAQTSCQQAELVFNQVVKVRAPDWLVADLAAAAATEGGR